VTAVARAPLLAGVDRKHDGGVRWRIFGPEKADMFGLDAQAVTLARILLLQRFKIRLLHSPQASNVPRRKRIWPRQLTLAARPNEAIASFVGASAGRNQGKLHQLPAALGQDVTRQIVFQRDGARR
jgi:hypothetical protein